MINSLKDTVNIAVIIPHFNDEQRLHTCLSALNKQTIAQNLYHIYVVDNGSQNIPNTVVDQFNNVTLLVEEKPGSYNARNLGISAANAQYYAFTDSDCVPDPLWLESAISTLSTKEIDAISGPIELFSQNKNKPSAIEMIDICFAFPQKDYIFKKHYSPTANLIVKKSALDKVGVFNGALMSGGDAEWGLRLFHSGGKLDYCEETKILHPARYSYDEFLTKKRRVTHGDWARRNSDEKIKKKTSVLATIALFIPPVQRIKQVIKYFPHAKTSDKLAAAWYLYFGKIYTAYHYTLCRLGLIKEAERR